MARKKKDKQPAQPKATKERSGTGSSAADNRRDEVGRSGVYPASGPLPPNEAEVQSMPAWGQGERGAAGYEDSGSSEIWFTRQELADLGRPGVGRDEVQVGQEVFSSDGQRVGHVKDIRERDIVVGRTLAPDVFIMFESLAAREAPGRLTLRLPLAQVDAQV